MNLFPSADVSFPPPDYVRGPSKVEGIEVYLPGSSQQKRPDLVDFKCPKCGATTAFSVEAGKLYCRHCGFSEDPQGQVVGRSAEKFEFLVETMQRSQQGWGEERKELACQRCGGVVSTPLDTLAYSCPFCESNKVLFREPLEDVLRPRFLIPFKIDPHTCRQITHKWLGSSWMLPAALHHSAAPGVSDSGKFHALYIPYWTFEATGNAAWKAQVAHRTTEYYFDEKGERQQREHVTWRNESGKVQKAFHDLLVPGTTRLNLTALSRIDSFNLQDLVLYEPRYLAGMQAQAYDFPLDQAWDAGRRIMRERTRAACLDRASSSEVRNFSMTLDFSDEKWRYVLAPLYTSIYRYGEETYQILINGQNGKIAGPRPVDWKKVWMAITALLLPGLLLSLIGLAMPLTNTGTATSGLGVFLLLIGLVISFFIFRQAQGIENV
jgi:DNA-directed RNA polymerase subunit RPC12/RpoP